MSRLPAPGAFAWMLLVAMSVCVPLPGAARDPGPGGWAGGDPLRVRNATPITQLFGLPRTLGTLMEMGRVELTLLVEHGNSFSARARGESALVLDGSTTVTSLALRGGARGGWEWGLEVPWIHHGGGFTDGFIEGYHNLFGFPDGERDMAPRNRLDYRVIDGGRTIVDVTRERHHLGDVRAWLGYRVHQAPGREAVLRMMVEAPTGDVGTLSGSEGTDVSLWAELIDERWLDALGVTMTLGAGVTAPGGGELADDRRALVPHAHLGLHYPLTQRLILRAQLDGHGDLIDSEVPRLGQGALLGTIGSSVRLSSIWRLDVALVEDLTPERAPDVVFLMMLGARW